MVQLTAPEHHGNEPVIHHLLCAYVGPRSDFQTLAGLLCPKCQRVLHHDRQDWEVLSGEEDSTAPR
jgi:hypothetical protein